MKYVFEVTEVEAMPTQDPYNSKSWPKPGVYRVKSDPDKFIFVSDFSVDTVWRVSQMGQPFNDPGESVSESLLLKAIAAASHASVLKGAQ